MITYINSDNAKYYSALFENATQDLKDLGVVETVVTEGGEETTQAPTISTIEQYFYYLPQLITKLGNNDGTNYEKLHSKGRRYAMLPLDEEYFEIDANKRDINIPKDFASNGIAVQGDQLAEVVYFKVDRYFDAKDLDDTDIYIQWVNAEGQKGISAPFVIDIESEANKLIFGWAIPNVVTKVQGNIQFAVRFYKWANEDEKKTFSYSLATQTKTIKVNSTLDFNFDAENIAELLRTDSENQILLTRLENSKTKLTNAQDAEEPIFVLNLEKKAVDLVDGKYTLRAQAQSPDAGTISFNWHYVNPDNEAENTSIENKMVYVLTEDTTPDDDKIYFYKNEKSTEQNPAYSVFAGKDGFKDSVEYFEQFATCDADKVGEYYVTATNFIAGKNYKDLDSVKTTVPEPVVPIAEMSDEFFVLGGQDSQSATISVSVTNEETNGTANGELSYQWAFDALSDGEANFVDISEATNSSLTVSYNADHPELVEGTYKVSVVNNKNKVKKSPVNAEQLICHVYYIAEAPVLVEQKDAEGKVLEAFYLDEVTEENPLKVEVSTEWMGSKPNIATEKTISYQWFVSEDRTTGTKEDDKPVEGAVNNIFVPTEAGKYYCVVTNSKSLGNIEMTNEASTVGQLYIVNPN